MLITLPELIACNSFAIYFSKVELLQPIIDLYSEILKSSEMSTTRVFLNLVQALETYHSRFITNDFKEFKKRIRLVILKDRPEEFVQGDMEFLMAKSNGYITLESRLADLLIAEFRICFDTGDIKRFDFPKVIARTRNYYIHYDERKRADGRILSEEEMSIYSKTLLYMLEYYLLLELGFSDIEQIREKLNNRWENVSQTLSLIRKSKEIEKLNVDIPSSSSASEVY